MSPETVPPSEPGPVPVTAAQPMVANNSSEGVEAVVTGDKLGPRCTGCGGSAVIEFGTPYRALCERCLPGPEGAALTDKQSAGGGWDWPVALVDIVVILLIGTSWIWLGLLADVVHR